MSYTAVSFMLVAIILIECYRMFTLDMIVILVIRMILCANVALSLVK